MENSLPDAGEALEMVTTQRIEETVKDILKEADMDQMTEFKLRIAASAKLDFDLSGENHKKLVRDVLEAFLLSNPDEATVPETVAPASKETAVSASNRPEEQRFIYKFSETKNVTVDRYNGRAFVSIGKTFPPEYKRPFRGIHFPTKQWSEIKKHFTAIEEAIKLCQSKSLTKIGDSSEAVDNNSSDGFVPIETTRFDGKSYHCWASQMELFLKQLNLSYVLFESSPGTGNSQGPETDPRDINRADATGKDWSRDDYLCHNHLLKSLSDHLYRQYSKKFKHAKELWDELKWVYQCEESNSKRSQVRKYIEFNMVEEKPILEQVQDFNKIADSIVSAGMFLDETFHVSTIISKFPSSWRGFCTKLMEEEFLPVWMLMERVKAEEDCLRNGAQRVTYRPVSGSCHMERRPSLGTTHRGSQSIGWKRKEPERDGRVTTVCDNCGRKGHLAKNCWGKNIDERAFKKPNQATSLTNAPVISDTHATTNNDSGVVADDH